MSSLGRVHIRHQSIVKASLKWRWLFNALVMIFPKYVSALRR